jgi:phytoene synthase
VALYAFEHELEHVAHVAREPLARQIRLTWWQEAIDELFTAARPRRHPVVEALGVAIARGGLEASPFEAMIEARFDAADAGGFADELSLLAYLDATAGGVMRLALIRLAPGIDVAEAATPGARACGLAKLAAQPPLGWTPSKLRDRVAAARADARAAARRLPPAAFPALAHVTLAPARAAGRDPSGLEARLRLLAAVLAGQL